MELSKQAKAVLGEHPAVTMEEFMERLWSINPTGNVEDTYIQTAWTVARVKDFEGKNVSFDSIVQKYSSYVEQQQRAGRRKIKSIFYFLYDRGYNEHFGMPAVQKAKLDRLI